jgi:predicted site-specific integrase-resolvase
MNDQYVSPIKIHKRFAVTRTTLQRWASAGKIDYIVTPTGRWLYSIQSVEQTLNTAAKRKKAIYCRVSSKKQSEDLARQVSYLQGEYPGRETFQDIGSGLNWNRKNFNTLLEQVMQGDIEEIVVAYKDRLARFSFDLIKKVCDFHGTEIVVHHNDPKTISEDEALSQDLLSIINVFVARNNGKRSKKNKKEIAEEECKKECKEKSEEDSKKEVKNSSKK